jgi:anhydro-N-acetylmuramic acid kinase
LSELNANLGLLHGEMVIKCLKRWGVDPRRVTCIASHGQTVFHSPKFLFPTAKLNSTLQVGDGDHIAMKTGIVTISDFRQKHIAAGGEGAPLAVYGDYLLFSKQGENRILLNMGGIANFTYLPGSAKSSDVFVTDTGPGNTLLDQAARRFLNKDYDKNAGVAKRGNVSLPLLNALKRDPFFKRAFPKTVGPELFNLQFLEAAQRHSKTNTLSVPDVMATLTRFSADTITDAIKRTVGNKTYTVYYSGGGAHNPLLMQWISEGLGKFIFLPMDVLGIPGDAKEAVLFAVLANETLNGNVTHFGGRSKIPSVTMGKISLPY